MLVPPGALTQQFCTGSHATDQTHLHIVICAWLGFRPKAKPRQSQWPRPGLLAQFFEGIVSLCLALVVAWEVCNQNIFGMNDIQLLLARSDII